MLYRKRLLLLIIGSIFWVSFSYAQNKQANNWYFGHNAGITFNTPDGIPQAVFDGQIDQIEGCASISDPEGNLLFYTDGMTVWNALHDTMPNGFGLAGHPSSTMSAIVVPWPGRDSLYYLFTVPFMNSSIGLNYYIVNMNLDNGLGDVVNGVAHYLTGPTEEMVTAVQHADGQSVWIITHLWGSNTFHSFLVDQDSIHSDPIVCSIGKSHNATWLAGYMKASMQGQYICCAVSDDESFQIFQFDNATALLSDPVTLHGYSNNNAYGLEFSPEGNKVYLSFYDFLDSTILVQYDLSIYDSSAIVNSSVIINTSHSPNFFSAMQIGPDNRIYIARYDYPYLSIIENPNEDGLACVFVDSSVYLDDGSGLHMSKSGLPAFIQSFFNPANFSWEGHCIGDTTFFAITDTASQDSVFWDFGDPASGLANYSDSFFPYHIYEDTGAYQVSVIGYNNSLNDTTVQEILIHPLPVPLLPTDTGFCEGYGVNLWPGNFQSYLWQNGSTDTSFYADTTLSVIVEVTDVQGCKNLDTTQAVEHSKPEGISIFHN